MALAILEVTSVGDKSPKSKQRDKNQKDAAKDKGKKAPPPAAASQPPGKKK